jgi:shikimate dehydrogenase
MHNAAFAATELDYVYVAFYVRNVQQAAEGVKGFGIRGLSVTIPHKVEIMRYLDHIAPLAAKIGAVNTVINDNGILTGTNTDADGALRAIEEHDQVQGKTVAILGVGGAARAVAFAIACERCPQRLILLYRPEDESMAAALLAAIQPHTAVPLSTVKMNEATLRNTIPVTDILVHTTPVGMHPHTDACLVPESLFSERHLVFDIIYNPAKTLLLQRAESRGARVINGIPMFVYQGAEQFRLWTGLDAPVDTMKNAVESALGYK